MCRAFKIRGREAVVAGFFRAKGKRYRYKLFWMGGKERSDGVGMFVAEKWVDSVVSAEKHCERVLILKMVLDNGLLNVRTVHAPHSGKLERKRTSGMNRHHAKFHQSLSNRCHDMSIFPRPWPPPSWISKISHF